LIPGGAPCETQAQFGERGTPQAQPEHAAEHRSLQGGGHCIHGMRALHACLALLVTIARSRRAVAWALPPPAACYVRVWWSGTFFYHSVCVASVVIIYLTGRAADRASQSWHRNFLAADPNPGLGGAVPQSCQLQRTLANPSSWRLPPFHTLSMARLPPSPNGPAACAIIITRRSHPLSRALAVGMMPPCTRQRTPFDNLFLIYDQRGFESLLFCRRYGNMPPALVTIPTPQLARSSRTVGLEISTAI